MRWRRWPQRANVEHPVTMPLNGAQLDVAVSAAMVELVGYARATRPGFS